MGRKFEDIIDQFRQAFGDDPTTEQLEFMIQLIKHCRTYCRNNSALANYLTREFKTHRFSMVQHPGNDYKSLVIREL